MNNKNNGKLQKVSINSLKKEKSLIEILQIILKNKSILFTSLLVTILLALIYSFIVTPKFEAVAILKKETNPDENRFNSSDISNMLNLQSLDAIETEMQLVTTSSVLSKVVSHLNLFCTVEEIKWNNQVFKIEKTFIDMSDSEFKENKSGDFAIPQKFVINFKDTANKVIGDFIIKKLSKDSYVLLNASDSKSLCKSIIDTVSIEKESNNDIISKNQILDSKNFSAVINWSEAPINSELKFSLNDFDKTVEDLKNSIKVNREGKTDIFYIVASASTPTTAAIIANTIVDKYRESRMAQKKETIRYSYDFVDKQLNEIQEKLKNSEKELSGFKATGQIMSIDASSQELMNFISNLEAEKYNTDLQLADYKNKAADLEKELKTSGYFDQSLLNPQGQVDGGNTPFSQLMQQIADLELKRIELLQKRTENHPDVIAIDDQIKLAKSRLAGYNENTIAAYKIMINTLEKKLLKITDLMSKYEVKLRGLPSQENKLAQLLREKGTYEKIFTILLDQREAMRVAELSKMQDITIVDAAKIPLKPSWPKKPLIILISLVLGGLIGIIAILIMELYRKRFINIDELENELQVPILSIIPKYSKETLKELKNPSNDYRLATLMNDDNGLIETFRLFRTKLFQKLGDRENIVLITSCEENSGKTTVAANLAVSLSQEGKRVLLVDCDLRKGDLSKIFGLSIKDNGLIDFLTKDVNPKLYSRVSKLIDILPSGGLTNDSGTLLNSHKMKSIFSYLSHTKYDLIIFDSPPITRVVDPLILAQFIKNVIIVVRPNHSLIETVRWGFQELDHTNANLIGIVANGADIKNSYYYRYRYGYGYGYGESKINTKKSEKYLVN